MKYIKLETLQIANELLMNLYLQGFITRNQWRRLIRKKYAALFYIDFYLPYINELIETAPFIEVRNEV